MDKKLVELKNKLKKQNIKGLALDIDEVLSDSNSHWFDHMINFRKLEGLSKEAVIKKYKFVEEVPEWQTEEGGKHIMETVHSNDFNETIPLIEGADETVREINKIVPIVAYITARPETVIEGTLNWLRKYGFPEAELITRPKDISLAEFDLSKNRWKAGILKTLYPEVVGIVDDNPMLARELEAIDYKGTQYLYGDRGE
jgi:5'(3')-deoxyribonucleotidase